ncbi:MAG: hypothetical protein QME25_08885 [Bacteroidota bacterium]|nr:hypothetical protein [Bacteroidota bacterium]
MKTRRYHIIIATTLFGILMWLSINMTQEYTVVLQVPVILKNFSDKISLKSPVPKTLTLKIKGIGWHLTSLYISGNIQFVVDVSKINANQTIHTNNSVNENFKLPSSINILDVHPDSLVISIEEFSKKKVKIIPQIVMSFRESYGQIGEAILIPDSVIIGGARSVVDTLKYWMTEQIIISDLREPVNLDLKLEEPPEYILKLFQNKINYKIDIQPFAEKSIIGLNVEVNYLPINKEVVFIPTKMDIIIRGSIEKLKEISSADFRAYVDFPNLVSNTLGNIQPEINVPDGIKIVRRNPEKFQYVIRKRLQ